MNILVTGCAGFIGSHLCEYLLRHDHTVVGIDNMNQFYDPELKKENLISIESQAEKLNKPFVFYESDIRHQDQVAQIYNNHQIEAVIHLAAMAGVQPSLENPLLYVDVNERGTVTILEEAKKAGIQKFIFGSSSSVYGNNKSLPFRESDSVDHPISPYAATKKAGEIMCHVYHKLTGMSIACLRFFTVYGPRQRPDLSIHKFTRYILDGKKIPVYGDGTQSRDFTYIDDIIDGIHKALIWVSVKDQPRYDIFNIGESEATDVNTLVNMLSQALNLPADKQYLPALPGDVRKTCADISKAREVLGFDPKVKLLDGIKNYTDWVLKKRR